MSLLEYWARFPKNHQQKNVKNIQRDYSSKAICGYWDRLTRDSLSPDLASDSVKKKREKRLLFKDGVAIDITPQSHYSAAPDATMIRISIVYGGRHVSKFDWNLNSAPLLLFLFCRVVNTARWCYNLVTGLMCGCIYDCSYFWRRYAVWIITNHVLKSSKRADRAPLSMTSSRDKNK